MRPPSYLEPLLPKPWREHRPKERALFKALIAFAAGDSFGSYYEFAEINKVIPNELRGKPNWPLGGISDDTMLTLLTLESLRKSSPKAAAAEFLQLLQINQGKLRGLGPTTRAALGMEVKPEELSSLGNTNGAMMRTAILAMALEKKEVRTEWIETMVKTTHSGERAINASVALADLIHVNELERAKRLIVEQEFPQGVSNDAQDTYIGVCQVLSQADSLQDIFKIACSIGGDTDTTSALSGSIYTFWNQSTDEIFEIEWLKDVAWSELDSAATSLSALYELVDLI